MKNKSEMYLGALPPPLHLLRINTTSNHFFFYRRKKKNFFTTRKSFSIKRH